MACSTSETELANVLLDEARHRHANEFAAALATLHLVRADLQSASPLIDEAIARLDASVRIERLLLNPGSVANGELLLKLCHLISRSRASTPTFRVRVLGCANAPSIEIARIFLMVAYELLTNAAKNNPIGNPYILVRLRFRPGNLHLTVVNMTGDNFDAEPVGGVGLSTVRRLVKPLAGHIASARDQHRNIAQAMIPMCHTPPPRVTRLT